MTGFTYSRPGTNMAQLVGSAKFDTAGIEAKLDALTHAIMGQETVIEMPEREEPEINISVAPTLMVKIDWEPLADALYQARPIVNVQPAEAAPISLSSSPVVLQRDPALVWGVYAIAFILACIFTLISCAFYYYSFA